MMRYAVSLTAAILASAAALPAQDKFVIANDLGLPWPGDLVHLDAAGDVPAAPAVKAGDRLWPAQVQRVQEGGKAVNRVWFLAEIAAGQKELAVELVSQPPASPLKVTETADAFVVANGVYEFRVPKMPRLSGPAPVSKLPSPLGGVRPAGGATWFGQGSFDGDEAVAAAKTEVLASGPVFVDVRVTLEFASPPAVSVKHSYAATLRFLAGDPWVQVEETYSAAPGFGHRVFIKDDLKPDTVMWIRWFAHGEFGGNQDMHFAPLGPLPKQRGPFVALQARWTQQPGCGQDFFLTRGGASPSRGRDGKETAGTGAYDPNAPAVGFVATHPTKWKDPYRQTIACYAENGDTARVVFPCGSGSRAFAICCGPRKLFDSTGKLNFLVRRHVDWTLDNQAHKYILTWKRDPAKAGPHILLSREQLQQIQDDHKAGRDTPTVRALREYAAGRDKLKRDDQQLLDLLTGKPVPASRGAPGAGAWIGSRYQADFLNPTTATRSIKKGFPPADLYCGGKPIGDAWTAAAGYVFTDLNHWPGWTNGWNPGNPNFHTDKYSVAIYAGAALLDHPHAKDWLAFGRKNFDEDMSKVLLPPDGVGYECPGYSGYSLREQLALARVFANVGMGDPVVENPLFKARGRWHRHLLTPRDVRLGIRHQAPIGDTHRWGAGEGFLFGMLGKFYKTADPAFASEMMGMWKLYRDQGMGGDLMSDVIDVDQSIPPMPVEKMDWASRTFHGFGAVMRSRFGREDETFVSFKAGQTHGHYHNDDLSYHFHGAGRPVSLDYNCSYHPRGDHAALHNSMTFGVSKPYLHQDANKPVEAAEQLGGRARVGVFVGTAAADLVVAERDGNALELRPIYPEDARFAYAYPRRAVERIVHRRWLALVKHAEGGKLADYLVVRDDTISAEPQQINIHLLARDVKRDGAIVRAPGQWDANAVVFLATAEVTDFGVGRWYYGPDGGEARRRMEETDGKTLIPPPGHTGRWMEGEYQKWVRVSTKPGTNALWVLYAHRAGAAEPKFETIDGGAGVRVSLGGETDEVVLSPARGGIVRRNGKATVLLEPDALPPLGEMKAMASHAY
jgi:hypothetical protein